MAAEKNDPYGLVLILIFLEIFWINNLVGEIMKMQMGVLLTLVILKFFGSGGLLDGDSNIGLDI